MTRIRHIVAASLVAIAILSVAAPGLVCVVGMWSSNSHSCCVPATVILNGLPSPGAASCCVTTANNSAVPGPALNDITPTAQVVAIYESTADVPVERLSSATATDASPPGCCTSSILRI